MSLGVLLLVSALSSAPAPLPVVHSATDVVAAARKLGPATVVHFWATWCGTCTEELPEIRRLERSLAAQGGQILFVSLDDPKQVAKVAKFMAAKRLFPAPRASAVLLEAPDPSAITPRFDAKWTAQLPATFLLLESGAVAASYLGTTPVDAVLRDAASYSHGTHPEAVAAPAAPSSPPPTP